MNQAAEEMLGWTLQDLARPRHARPRPLPPARRLTAARRREHDPADAGAPRHDPRRGRDLHAPRWHRAARAPTPPRRWSPARGSRAASSSSPTRTARQAEQARARRKLEALSWVGRVQDALREERFVLYAQPIVDLAPATSSSTSCCCACASPTARSSGPARFLPIAEEYGLIGDIDRWVIRAGAELAGRGHRRSSSTSRRASIGDPALLDHIERAASRDRRRPGAARRSRSPRPR